MKNQGEHIILKFLKQWQMQLVFETLLYGLGVAIMIYFVSNNILLSILSFIIISGTASLFVKPWKVNLQRTTNYLDTKLPSAENSSSLLISPLTSLSGLAQLQQLKIAKRLEDSIKTISPPSRLKQSAIVAFILIILGIMMNQLDVMSYLKSNEPPIVEENAIVFKTKDSLVLDTESPRLLEQWVTIRYPEYTNIKSIRTSKMDLKILEGSRVFWSLKFDRDVKNASLESMGNTYPMILNDEGYKYNKALMSSGFYNFKFFDTENKMYASDLYAIDIIKDESPSITIQGLKQFTSFNYDDVKVVNFNSAITDDFGIANAYIVATVSKGTGESVKFREEKLTFDNQITSGSKKMTLSKRIDLSSMNMEPGDELYFYIEVSDLKQPRNNTARSETYFAVIKDTTSYEFGVESSLGVSRMPDYFRSQRQLIIDTEKLIDDKKELSLKVFKFKSNELGFDQKSLRLKYGEFMGVESDSGLDSQEGSPEETNDHNEEDPLAKYTHDHDGDNEHNLVENKDDNKDKTSKNPIQEFMHDHGDPEMGSLFEESLKTKMNKAMSEMWDAELYLRLYEPQKSLPYQYRALKLIQEIKNHARIYVHRIGFDPPPIKEDKRLTGKIDEVSSFRKGEDIQEEDKFVNIRQTIILLENTLARGGSVIDKDLSIFEGAATELSALAIEFPGKYLQTLQQLKFIIDGIVASPESLKETRRRLLSALPRPIENPTKTNMYLNEIDRLLLKELDAND